MTRRFDGYIAGTEDLQIGEVLFLGPARVVVRHRFESKAEWEAERSQELKSGDESRRHCGMVWDGKKPGEFDEDGSIAPPDDKNRFYGVDHV